MTTRIPSLGERAGRSARIGARGRGARRAEGAQPAAAAPAVSCSERRLLAAEAEVACDIDGEGYSTCCGERDDLKLWWEDGLGRWQLGLLVVRPTDVCACTCDAWQLWRPRVISRWESRGKANVWRRERCGAGGASISVSRGERRRTRCGDVCQRPTVPAGTNAYRAGALWHGTTRGRRAAGPARAGLTSPDRSRDRRCARRMRNGLRIF